jgi:hypothetical protein
MTMEPSSNTQNDENYWEKESLKDSDEYYSVYRVRGAYK